MARRPDAVVLAAGRSSRVGEPKGLLIVEGRRWLDLQLDGVEAAGVARVAVVLGRDGDLYRAALPTLGERALVVDNPEPDRGPFSSLQCALGALATREGPIFVLPVDVPAAAPGAWGALERALTTAPEADAAVPEGGGHPVLLAPGLVPRLRAAPATSRLDHELARSRVVRVPTADPRVRLNLNHLEDWRKLERGR